MINTCNEFQPRRDELLSEQKEPPKVESNSVHSLTVQCVCVTHSFIQSLTIESLTPLTQWLSQWVSHSVQSLSVSYSFTVTQSVQFQWPITAKCLVTLFPDLVQFIITKFKLDLLLVLVLVSLTRMQQLLCSVLYCIVELNTSLFRTINDTHRERAWLINNLLVSVSQLELVLRLQISICHFNSHIKFSSSCGIVHWPIRRINLFPGFYTFSLGPCKSPGQPSLPPPILEVITPPCMPSASLSMGPNLKWLINNKNPKKIKLCLFYFRFKPVA